MTENPAGAPPPLVISERVEYCARVATTTIVVISSSSSSRGESTA